MSLPSRRPRSGFGVLEVLVGGTVLALGVLALSSGFSLLFKSERKVEEIGELEDVRNFFRQALDCRETMARNAAGCTAASFVPIPYNRFKQPLVPSGGGFDGTLIGRNYKARVLCGTSVGADTLDVQYAKFDGTDFAPLFPRDTPIRCPRPVKITSPPAAWYCDGRHCCYPPPGSIPGTDATSAAGVEVFPDIPEGTPVSTPYADCYTPAGNSPPTAPFKKHDLPIYGPCQWFTATDPTTGATFTWCFRPIIGWLDELLCIGAPLGEPWTTNWFEWSKPLGREFDPGYPFGYTLAIGGGHLHHCTGVGLRIRIRGNEHPANFVELVCRGPNCAGSMTARQDPSPTFIETFNPREEFEVRPEDLRGLLDSYGEKQDSGYTIEVAWNYNVELGNNPYAVWPTSLTGGGAPSCTGVGRRAGFSAGMTFVAKGAPIPSSTCDPALGIP